MTEQEKIVKLAGLMGWEYDAKSDWFIDPGVHQKDFSRCRADAQKWNPFKNWSHAGMLVEKMIMEPWEVYLTHQFDGWHCILARPDRPRAEAQADTAPAAISEAALATIKGEG